MEKKTITPEEYHKFKFDKTHLPDIEKAGYISGSTISLMRDPFKFLVMGEKKQTNSMEWGSLIDMLWLTPLRFDEEYIIQPENAPSDLRRFRDSKKPSQETIDSIKWWDEFEKKAKGRNVVSISQMSEARRAIWMLENHPVAKEIHSCSEKQCCYFGNSVLGLPGKMKGMTDLVPDENSEFGDAIVDLKTTHDISTYAIRNTMFTFEYFMKMRLYIEIVNEYERESGTGKGERKRAIMIFEESIHPYRVRIVEIPMTDLDLGEFVIRDRVLKMTKIHYEKPMETINTSVSKISMRDWMRESVIENESVGT